MKKKIFLVFIILFIILGITIIYLNQIVLPTKIKSLIVSGLGEATHKKVSLGSLQFNIFKGLVLRDLVIYDEQTTIMSVKEGSCVFLIWPILQKKIIIPALTFKSASLPSGIYIPEGRLEATIDLNLKDNLIKAKISAQNKDLTITKDKLSLKLNAQVWADLRYSLKTKQLEYSIDTEIAGVEFSGQEFLHQITGISGRIKFNNSGLAAEKLKANVLGIPVEAKINLTDFQAPVVQADLFSQDLQLETNFQVKDKLITISECKGQYLNSPFSLQGAINAANPGRLETEINADLNIDLKDMPGLLKKFSAKMLGGSATNYDGKDQLERIQPQGIVQARFNLQGNINDLKSCAIKGSFSGSSLSLYGLKATEFLLDYNQANGLIDISRAHLSLYDGTIEAGANVNLNSRDLPFWLSADIQGVKLEKLKLDTDARDKDIAGTIAAAVKINGFSDDLSKLNGAGQISISEGKLWQLNLFKGLGSLLFVQDFSQIIFNEGSCAFSIQDKYIFTDNLKLKSNITDLTGSVKIGFDSSIDASLNIQVLDEMVPLSGTFKDITTAILGQTGRFGIIRISGTLKEPKYKFQPAVADIIKGIKNILFGNPQQ